MSQTFKSVEEIKEHIDWLKTLYFEIEEYGSNGLLTSRWVKGMTNMLSLRIIHMLRGIEFCMTREAYLSINPWVYTGEFIAKDADKQKARNWLDSLIKQGEVHDQEYEGKMRNQKKKNVIIGGNIMSGKTTALILEANKEGLPIVVSTRERAEDIKVLAKSMQVDEPRVIFFKKISEKDNEYDGVVLVDEIEQILEFLIGWKIATASTSLHMQELESRANEGCKDNIKHRNLYENVNEIAPCCKEIFKNIE